MTREQALEHLGQRLTEIRQYLCLEADATHTGGTGGALYRLTMLENDLSGWLGRALSPVQEEAAR